MASSLPRPTLTPLQQRVLTAFRDVPGAYLTGGAALGHFYLGHRRSIDLDVFTGERALLDELAARLAAFCEAEGLALGLEREYPGFRRFLVQSEGDRTLVDLVHDPVPQTVPVADKPVHDGVRIDAIDDIVANKLGALLGRGETKDLVDLFFLSRSGRDPVAYLQPARERDGGLDAGTLAWVLATVSTDPSDLLLVEPVTSDELEAFRNALVDRLRRLAWPGPEPS